MCVSHASFDQHRLAADGVHGAIHQGMVPGKLEDSVRQVKGRAVSLLVPGRNVEALEKGRWLQYSFYSDVHLFGTSDIHLNTYHMGA